MINAIIIPRDQALKYRQIKLNWYTGIDAVEMENGDYFISKKCYDMLPEGFEITRDEVKFNVKTELSKLTARKVLVRELKVADTLEPIAVKKK